jgi:hypothetical protein
MPFVLFRHDTIADRRVDGFLGALLCTAMQESTGLIRRLDHPPGCPALCELGKWNLTPRCGVFISLGSLRAEVDMAHSAKSKTDKIEHPQAHYETPDDLINDQDLTPGEKKKALNVWEQDARQLLTASNEGMPGDKEGVSDGDYHRLGQVERAKAKMGEQPKRKAAH